MNLSYSHKSSMSVVNTSNLVLTVPAKLPRLVVYLPEEIKADLERLANAEHRSLSSMTLIAIEQMVKQAKAEGKI